MSTLQTQPPPSSSLKVAVLMGGVSNEREVSLSSGRSVASALTSLGHSVHALDVGPDITQTISSLLAFKPDVVFNALHGIGGEDGTIQGVLDWLKLPYTHSDVLASAMAMNKATSRIAFEAHNLPVAKGKVITPTELLFSDPWDFPYVIKPLSEGSSVGVTILHPGDHSRIKIAQNWQYGSHLLAEEYIPGRELTVSVLRDTPLTVTEILPLSGSFYDFNAKYQSGGSNHIVPALLSKDITMRVMDYACRAHKALGCQGASRTDFRYDEETERLVLLEVNTQPGMTPTSLLPEQAQWRGLSYKNLCDWIIREACALNKDAVSSLLDTD